MIMKTKTTVTQEITLTIKGQAIKLTKDEALEVARQLDEVTGRQLPAPTPIIIEKEIIRDRSWPWREPYFGTPYTPQWEYPTITCQTEGSGTTSQMLAVLRP